MQAGGWAGAPYQVPRGQHNSNVLDAVADARERLRVPRRRPPLGVDKLSQGGGHIAALPLTIWQGYARSQDAWVFKKQTLTNKHQKQQKEHLLRRLCSGLGPYPRCFCCARARARTRTPRKRSAAQRGRTSVTSVRVVHASGGCVIDLYFRVGLPSP